MNPSRHPVHFSICLLALAMAIGCGLLAGCKSSAISPSAAPASVTNGIPPSIPIFLTLSNPVSININNPAPELYAATNIIQISQQMSQLQTAINNLSNTPSNPEARSITITNVCQSSESSKSDGFLGVSSDMWVAVFTAVVGALGYVLRKLAEEKSVKLAILAEIRRLYHVIGRHYEWRQRVAAKRKNKKSDQPVESEPLIHFSFPVFSAQKKKIGVLPQKIVGDVVTFYGWVDFLNNFQSLQKNYTEMNKPYLFDARYDALLKKFMQEFRPIFGDDYQPGNPDPEPED